MSRRHPGSRFHARLDLRRWQATRRAAFERDSWRCTRCRRSGRLEGHHVERLEDDGDPYDVDNVRTVCRSCQIREHRPKMTPSEEAWRGLVRELATAVDSITTRR